ncbi:MAG: hypothetical protein AB7V61_15960 [Methylocystis sp.]|uniref:hypothetical protein n=1 Tax=Methylocystis sp. TaxID=1911079 RepID=UPI003D13725C
MSIPDTNEIAIALSCVTDAVLSAVDPSGGAFRRARCSLHEGLRLAEAAGAKSEAAEIIREVVATMSESENL